MKKLLIIDGHNLLVRSVFAMNYRPDRAVLTTVSGIMTGPLVAFVNALSQHVRAEKPTHVVVCWDGGKARWRIALDPDYKGNRVKGSYGEEVGPESPFTLAKEFLSYSSIPWVLRQNVEADDLVAAFALGFEGSVVILSNDKDFFQLVSHDIHQIRIGSGDTPTHRVTPDWLEEKYDIAPQQLGKVLALTGDTGDNVIGVPKIGPKTAVKMLKAHGFDLARTANEEPRLVDHFGRIIKNFSLVNLQDKDREVPVPTVPEFHPTKIGSVGYLDLIDWLGRYELRQIRDRLVSGHLWGEAYLS